MQVHDTPLALDAKGATQVVTVGAGGADIYYGPSPATATRAGGGTLAAAGTSFSITGTTWVVRSDLSRAPAADLTVVEAPPSVESASAPTAIVATVYDGAGNLTSITQNGATTTFTYNADGTVATETRGGRTATYVYDAAGNLTGSTVA